MTREEMKKHIADEIDKEEQNLEMIKTIIRKTESDWNEFYITNGRLFSLRKTKEIFFPEMQ